MAGTVAELIRSEPWDESETLASRRYYVSDVNALVSAQEVRESQGQAGSRDKPTDHGISQGIETDAVAPVPPVVMISFPERQLSVFIALQKWEGVVERVEEDGFWARLIDLTGGEPAEEVEFELEQLSRDDRQLVAPGAIFYWNIGYEDKPNGERRTVSAIRFRRLPMWARPEIEACREEARSLRAILKIT